ncbi:hypothetical protein HPT27_09525 [Permianibacter sp. IMCC34836]|uniref:hypothetical protein n=1 Tax=Permianibacter fluminis TaxID=2738515 RepID=UPI0015521B63|nr:hypothetical protein [Permianibacter fluminis]NQD37266.1 hypothetical protein [Permianibacter fluminis]
MATPSATASSKPDRLWPLLLGLSLALFAGFFWTRVESWRLTPQQNYWLGVVGASLMLLLFLYPLRKHVRFLDRLGQMKFWFQSHMWLGIGGPFLILLHSRFQTGSLNAAVAFYSMLVVAGSGIIGRFIYTRIHHGLFGRGMQLREWREHIDADIARMAGQSPDLRQRLQEWEQQAMAANSSFLQLLWLPLRLRHAERQMRAQHHATQQKDLLRALHLCFVHLRAAARFRLYERLFRWWHILHVPLVFTLVISTILHIISVHMY